MTINLKTAVDFNAEAQRCRVTQRKSKVLWGNGKYDNFSDRLNLYQLGVACMVLQNENNFQKTQKTLFSLRLCVSALKKEPVQLPNLGLKICEDKDKENLGRDPARGEILGRFSVYFGR